VISQPIADTSLTGNVDNFIIREWQREDDRFWA